MTATLPIEELEDNMTKLETVLSHMSDGTTYSWDLTVLLGLGIPVPFRLREKLLRSKTTSEEAAYVVSAYTGKLLSCWRS
jgi:hypothetical protein